MKRREWAWLVALVLAMELVLFACTCVQVNHSCPADAPCAICSYLHTMFRGMGLPSLAAGLSLLAVSVSAACAALRSPVWNGSLILKKVRMND
ncbi:MAG: hypothetical protein Q4E13_14315 [Clostridia bacterium]|nr:hypothetical protein [Clostridia bacterium]